MSSELAAAINDVAHMTGSFRLRSGATATEYFDKYQFEARPDLLARIAEAMGPLVPEGADIDGQRVLVVEDVVTSGGQIVLSTRDLRAFGASVTTAVCVIDREPGGREALAELGVELRPLFARSDLA